MASFLLPACSHAVTVGPAKIEYKVDPGQTISDKLFIVNDGQETRTFYAEFEKFTEIGGQKKFLPSEPAELAEWFKMEESATLKAGEQKEILFTVEVPENAPPGGHFAVIWWGTASPGKNQVSIVTRAGILVFLQVSGEINEKGEIVEFSLTKGNFFTLKLPEDFAVNFKNQGNTYLKPLGEITVKNIFGSAIADFNVNGKERIIFPDNEQLLDIAKKFGKPPFAFGFYKAELSLRWGEKESNGLKSIWFFVFPWKTVFVVIIILAGLFLLATKGVKKYNQWILEKYTKNH
ncbi:MAG: hypothetical protein ABIH10_01865 [Spirochaetota bacterium]